MNSSLGRVTNVNFIVSYVSHSKVLTSWILKIYSTGRFDDYFGNNNKFSVWWSKLPFLILKIQSGHVTYQNEANDQQMTLQYFLRGYTDPGNH